MSGDVHVRFCESRGVRLPPATHLVVLCSSREQAEQAQERATVILGELGLSLHPDKTGVVDLREGREGFDFLGCHLRARMSGRLWEQRRIIAADKFITMDRYVAWRLKRLLIKKRGRNLRVGQADCWQRTWFHDQGLHKLMGTIRYPKAA
jgi:RNA-directed DNA polymerase